MFIAIILKANKNRLLNYYGTALIYELGRAMGVFYSCLKSERSSQILFHINGLAIWHGFPDIVHIEKNIADIRLQIGLRPREKPSDLHDLNFFPIGNFSR